MKKLILIFAMALFSCSGDDEKEGDKASILGKWYYVSQTINGNRSTYYSEHDGNEGCNIIDDHVVFLDNGDVDFYFFEWCELQVTEDSRYIIQGDTLTFIDKDTGKAYDVVSIVELTDTTLVFRRDPSQNNDGDHVIMELER